MQNLLDPAILFFVVGVLAGALRSNLEIPPAIAKFLSLYLLMALGLKGGFALHASGLDATVAVSLLAAIAMAFLVPAIGYAFLRRHISGFDAAAVAASYGSVSAVTFVTAMQFLETQGTPPGGHMAAAMVLMESPAIIMAVLLANMLRQRACAPASVVASPGGGAALARFGGGPGTGTPLGKILHESFTDGAQLLLLGAMAIGFLSGDTGKAVMQPFSGDLFKGMLAFFLLDMGLLVARNFSAARTSSPVLLGYAVGAPLVHAAIALALGWLLGMAAADTALLMVLSASASYIVVPAVLRHAIPEANPSLYFGLSLGVTFPLNLMLGIPLYAWAARTVLG
ncbi:sodium-dependent bicarbonate transport family permease [Ramlibacter sp. AN1015]|uniref:sodium-dependent bicarbonate transport family permease n=1 Tax=Ramlibacter sp. AN1015 TaxID=3133428 RepID=UPI0030BBDE75